MEKKEQLYAGKAKSVYTTADPRYLVLHFRDDTSAFDGKKVEKLARKGMVNNHFNAFIMARLAEAGVAVHFERMLSAEESLVQSLEMLPVECVVRNFAAGSLCRRLGVGAGRELDPPVFEMFLKDDELGDPMINESHATTFGWATMEQLSAMKSLSLRVNEVLCPLFAEGGMMLVDYKLEFGVGEAGLVLGDEFTPDGCRLWDRESREKLDKDRFRQDLGGVVEAYEEVGRRLGLSFPEQQ